MFVQWTLTYIQQIENSCNHLFMAFYKLVLKLLSIKFVTLSFIGIIKKYIYVYKSVDFFT